MPDFFDHDADIGIIGTGTSIEAAFIDAADAVFSIMADITHIKPLIKIHISFTETDLEFALVTWLNLLLAHARTHNLILSKFELTRLNNDWHGVAYGEKWRDNIERGTEVKGATLTALTVKKENNIWKATCVVDV